MQQAQVAGGAAGGGVWHAFWPTCITLRLLCSQMEHFWELGGVAEWHGGVAVMLGAQ